MLFRSKIDRMSRRATDGDYSIAEMQDVLDCKPSIGRLYQTIKDFAYSRILQRARIGSRGDKFEDTEGGTKEDDRAVQGGKRR